MLFNCSTLRLDANSIAINQFLKQPRIQFMYFITMQTFQYGNQTQNQSTNQILHSTLQSVHIHQ